MASAMSGRASADAGLNARGFCSVAILARLSLLSHTAMIGAAR